MLAVGIVVGMSLSYFVIAAFAAWLFDKPSPQFSRTAYLSVGVISLCIVISYIVAALITDVEIGNRFQHAFGGGFAGFLSCFLSCKDTHLDVGRYRFLAIALLIVTAMGVGNEILEFFVQSSTHLIFSNNTLDTWRDLTSNSVGALAAAALLTPFWRNA